MTEQRTSVKGASLPNDCSSAKEWFDHAGVLDSSGCEFDARTAYEKAKELGLENLPEADKPRFYLQYGSTLRNLREFNLARSVLDEGCRLYPEHAALKLFKAFSESSAGDYKEAMMTLMKLVSEVGSHPSLTEYKKSINYYIDEIVSKHD